MTTVFCFGKRVYVRAEARTLQTDGQEGARFVLSDPCHDKAVSWMGHPLSCRMDVRAEARTLPMHLSRPVNKAIVRLGVSQNRVIIGKFPRNIYSRVSEARPFDFAEGRLREPAH